MLMLDPLVIENEAVKRPISEIAGYLQKTIGQKLTGYMVGLTDPKVVGGWISEKTLPKNDDYATRLRCAYKVVRMIEGAFDKETAKSWLLGTNSRLEEQSPAYVIRNATESNDYRLVVRTARTFAGALD